jgi:hypothetical protein
MAAPDVGVEVAIRLVGLLYACRLSSFRHGDQAVEGTWQGGFIPFNGFWRRELSLPDLNLGSLQANTRLDTGKNVLSASIQPVLLRRGP